MAYIAAFIGSREYRDYDKLLNVMTTVYKQNPDLIVCSGGAKGADILARNAAHKLDVPFFEFPVCVPRKPTSTVQYDVYVNAYYARNLAVASFADTGYAFFPGTIVKGGTKNTCKQMIDMGKTVYGFFADNTAKCLNDEVKLSKLSDFDV